MLDGGRGNTIPMKIGTQSMAAMFLAVVRRSFLSASLLRRLLLFAVTIGFAATVDAALLDVWRADDLNLNDGDAVGAWNSASNNVAGANAGENPILKRNATPAGGN